MDANTFWTTVGQHIKGLNRRKLFIALRKYDVKDTRSNIIYYFGGYLQVRDLRNFIR